MLKGFLLLALAVLMLSYAYAQEEKEEKKVIKIKMVTDDEGNVNIDTTIVIGDDFDGDWKDLIEDKELLEKLENITIDVEVDEEGVIYLKSDGSSENHYMYVTTEEEDGEMKVMVKMDGGEAIVHDIHVESVEHDSVYTYTIKTTGDGEDGEHKVIMWTTDDKGSEEMKFDILLDKVEGDSVKVIMVSSGDGEKVEVIKKSEVIIIKEDCDDDKKDKKKKKKKEDD